MKWFLVVVVVLNLLVAGYGSLKQRPVGDAHAQEISPNQVKLLPADWKPASAPEASAPAAASMPATEKPTAAELGKADASAAGAIKPEAASAAKADKPAADKPAKDEKKPVDDKKPAKTDAKADSKPAGKAETKQDAKPELACYDWGALESHLLQRVKGGLPSLHLKPEQLVESDKGETKGNGKFWVYHPPLATRSETQTLSAELKDKGFDNYIVSNEDFKGSVSLGLFGKEDAAKAMVAKIKAAGFDKAAMQQKGQKSNATLLTFKGLDPQQADKLRALQRRLTPGIALQACR
ncbi:SPOR domain-containing protein [uncultured Aquitalea sp.]|uniref:SPOR domain-containing protein n=1 Tax=uncultured Aquitalea sp. TaxID=540272 RepID=UPI0025CD1816|nr:SPOR domain-containing protein [uncultured Aquitalea sp.]